MRKFLGTTFAREGPYAKLTLFWGIPIQGDEQ